MCETDRSPLEENDHFAVVRWLGILRGPTVGDVEGTVQRRST